MDALGGGPGVKRRTVYINGGFAGQAVTGQQRYAVELSSALAAVRDVTFLTPPAWLRRRKIGSWLWVLLYLPVRSCRGILISLTSRVPLFHPRHIVAVHDLFVIDHPEWYSTRYRVTHRFLQKWSVLVARRVVAVSQPVAHDVERRWRLRHAVRVAPNAPAEIFSDGSSAAVPSQLGGFGIVPKAYIFCVGSRDPRKNVQTLIRAHRMLPERLRLQYPLVIAGGSSAVFSSTRIDATAEDARFIGYVSDEQLVSLYSHSSLVVFPSLAEGFGLPLVEASAAGARIAASDIPVFRWICGDSIDYFDPESAQSICRAMQAALSASDPPKAFPTRFEWHDSALVVDELISDIDV